MLWTSHIVIPIAVNIICYSSLDESNEGKTPYHVLFICYAVISFFSLVRIIFYFNRVVLGTYTWYRARHGQ